jgi:hypothetical protein
LLILLAALAACSSANAPEERACTLIGCSSGLSVAIDGPADGPFVVEASDGSVMETFECAAGARCERVTFDNYLPERVTVRVIAAGDTTTTIVEPTYTTLQPNGPGCPPTCTQATVTARKP